MVYVVAVVLSILVALNCYACWKVLRDELSTGRQKLMQVGLNWLLPVIGAVLTLILASGTRHLAMDDPRRSGIAFVSYWHSTEGESYSSDVSSDSSCD